MPDPKQLPHLLNLLEDDDPAVIQAVVDALAAFGTDLTTQLRSMDQPPSSARIREIAERVTRRHQPERQPMEAVVETGEARLERRVLYQPGTVVRHRRYGYRGVVVAVDLSCQASPEWYESNRTQPPRNQPWYHVLVHGEDAMTYAAQTSMRRDPDGKPVEHPLVPMYFDRFENGAYQRNTPALAGRVVTEGQTPLDEVRAELQAIEDAGLRRAVRCVSGDPAAERIDGTAATVLCANDYLGLHRDPRLAEAMAQAAASQGAGSGAARLISGTRPAHGSLEDAVRTFTGAPAALTFTSGFAANLAVLGSLLGPDDLAVSDRVNHASLIDGLRLTRATRRVVDHRDVAAFRDALRDADGFRRTVVVTEGLFSMDGDTAPLADLLTVARAAGALLFVDDAHGTGVLGPTGAGTLEAEGIGPEQDVVRIGTFGKAFGAAGAFVAAAEPVVDLVANRGRAFVFTTAPPPGVAAAAERGMRVAAQEAWRRERCLANARRLADRLRGRGMAVPHVAGPILPVLVESAERAVAASGRLLEEHGLFVAAIRPPTVPDGTARLRVTTSAAHDTGLIDRAADAIAQVLS